MPIYEYACGACGHAFEEWQKMSDPPVRTCPKCKKKKVDRLISQTAFQLKGGGWYADLYSSSKPGKSEGAEGGAGKDAGSAKSEGKSEGKSESKSESKSEGASSKKDTGAKKDASSQRESKASSTKKSETRAA